MSLSGHKYFAKLQSPKSVDVGMLRRIKHSASNKARATLKSGKASAAKNLAIEGANVAATSAAIKTVAASGAAIGAVGTILAGPYVATAIGAVGILSVAKSAYSNREQAHRKLTPYVHQYFKRNGGPLPIPEGKKGEKVKAAAWYLISEGSAQQSISSSKTDKALLKFEKWWLGYLKLCAHHDPVHKSAPEFVLEAEPARKTYLDAGIRRGGAVWECMRRLNHRANYVQAFTVVGQMFTCGPERTRKISDSFYNFKEVKDIRENLEKKMATIDSHQKVLAWAGQQAGLKNRKKLGW